MTQPTPNPMTPINDLLNSMLTPAAPKPTLIGGVNAKNVYENNHILRSMYRKAWKPAENMLIEECVQDHVRAEFDGEDVALLTHAMVIDVTDEEIIPLDMESDIPGSNIYLANDAPGYTQQDADDFVFEGEARFIARRSSLHTIFVNESWKLFAVYDIELA